MVGKPGPVAAVLLQRKVKTDICKPLGELQKEKGARSKGQVESSPG